MSIDTIGSLISPAVSVLGTVLSHQDSDKYYSSAGDAAQAQSQLTGQMAGLAQEQWDRYKRIYGPLEEAAAAEAARDIGLYSPLRDAQVLDAVQDIGLYRPLKEAEVGASLADLDRRGRLQSRLADLALDQEQPDYGAAEGQAEADVRSAFARSRGEAARRSAGLGLRPERTAYLDTLSGLDEAAALASARTSAREDEKTRVEDANLGRLTSALGIRSGLAQVPRTGLLPAAGASGQSLAASATGLLQASAQGLNAVGDNFLDLARTGLRRYQGLGNAGLGYDDFTD
jgi:hypothetical protein